MFPEAAIRKRLAAGYRRENKHHGRGTIDVDAAIRDVKTCLKEILRLQRADAAAVNYIETLETTIENRPCR